MPRPRDDFEQWKHSIEVKLRELFTAVNSRPPLTDLSGAPIQVGDDEGGLIVGDPDGAHLGFRGDGFNAYDGITDGPTVSINSDGTAAFRGSTVSANEIDANNMVINAGSTGALLMYGSGAGSTPQNTNPDFLTGITDWNPSATPADTMTYSSDYFYNGHNVLKVVNNGLFLSPFYESQIRSSLFPVTAGVTYAVDAIVLSGAPAPITASTRLYIDWLNAAGVQIGGAVGTSMLPTAGVWARMGYIATAPAGATQGRLAIFGFANVPTSHEEGFYVAHCALSTLSTLISLAQAAGVDPNGVAYPAGLNAPALAIAGQPVQTVALSGSAGDLTSGILPAVRGGTGWSGGNNGYVLVGNAAGTWDQKVMPHVRIYEGVLSNPAPFPVASPFTGPQADQDMGASVNITTNQPNALVFVTTAFDITVVTAGTTPVTARFLGALNVDGTNVIDPATGLAQYAICGSGVANIRLTVFQSYSLVIAVPGVHVLKLRGQINRGAVAIQTPTTKLTAVVFDGFNT